MSLHRRIALLAPFALAFCAGAANAADAPGLGKPVSEADLALWDISIGPDGKGLPAGSGTPTEGAAIYAQKCEVCHGKNGYGGKNAVLATPPDKPGPDDGDLCTARNDDLRLYAARHALAAAKVADQ